MADGPWSVVSGPSPIVHGLINESPLDPETDDHSLGGIMRCGKIIIGETKTIPEADGVQVFGAEIAGK